MCACTAEGTPQCGVRSQPLRALVRECGVDAEVGLCVATVNPGTSGFRCRKTEVRSPGNWGGGIVPLGIPSPGQFRVHPRRMMRWFQKSMDSTTTDKPTNNEARSQLSVPPSRRGSQASSMGSEFSHATALDTESCERDWEELLKIRKEVEEILNEADELLKNMSGACRVQKNVNSTVKEGIPTLAAKFARLRILRRQENSQQERYHQGVFDTGEARDARKRIRSRIQGRLLKDAVLAARSSVQAKRERSPSGSSDEHQPRAKARKKKKKQQKKDEKAVAEGHPAITVTKPDQGAVAVKPGAKPKASAGTSSVLVRVASGQSYAGVLGKIRKDLDPDTCSAKIVCARPTPKGDVILRLGKGSDRQKFAAALGAAVGEVGSVVAPEKRVSVEVRDLDSLTEKQEVVGALEKFFGGFSDKRGVSLGTPNKRQLRLAVLDLSEGEAAKLLKIGHLRVGFLSCAVRLRTVVLRCFKCLGYGHRRSECTGVDRSTLCYKCGGSDHHHRECSGKPHCFLCSELDPQAQCEHVAGSGACRVFRLALENARQAENQRKKKPARRRGK